MNQYRVMWFDDQCEDLPLIKENAKVNGISLIGFSNAKQGIDELRRNIEIYDAAIIDGLFYMEPDELSAPSDDAPFFKVAMEITKLESVKVLPWFILSGQFGFTEGKNRYADAFKNNKVYHKTNDDHLARLWEDIKKEASKQVETQIRHRYQRVFEVCTERYIGTNASNDLLAILKSENLDNAFRDPKLYFNPLRKIMEDLFTTCHNYGFLPECFIKPSVALNETSKFLSGGVEKGYQLDTPVFIKIISEHVRNILSVCQPAAHRSEIDSFVSTVDSPYLLLSTTYQLLDVLLWFKEYFNANKNVETNKARFKLSGDAKTEIIEKDDMGNYHCGEVLLSFNFIKHSGFKVDEEIKILSTIKNLNNKTKHLYPKFANKIAKA